MVRFIEYMDVGTLNEWDPDERGVGARGPRADRPRDAARAGRSRALERRRRSLPLSRRRRRAGHDRLGDRAVLRRLRPRPADRRRAALHLPVRRLRARPQGTAALRRRRPRPAVARSRAIWQGRSDRYSEERAEELRSGRSGPVPKIEMYRIGG